MSGEPLLLLLASSADVARCETLAKVLTRECAECGVPWRVVVDAEPRPEAQRVALILPDRPPSRRQVTRRLRKFPAGHVCLVRLGAPLSGQVTAPLFDLSRWPGLESDAALEQFVAWLALPVQSTAALSQAWLERVTRQPVRAALFTLLAALVLGGWYALKGNDTSPADGSVRVASPPAASADANVAARDVPSVAELERAADGTLEYDSTLLSRGMHMGVIQGRWEEADELVQGALRQAPDDVSVAATAARYWMVRGDFAAASHLLTTHEARLHRRDGNLLRQLHARGDAASQSRVCLLAQQPGDAWLRYAQAQFATGALHRGSLLDDVCLARLVHSERGAPLRELLELG